MADPTDYYDDYGHGTHVSGTIGAKGNNALGTTGVNWQVSILPIKAADENGEFSVADIISGINYAAAQGASIINASFGGSGYSQSEYDAINSNSSILLVAAAGNNSSNNDITPEYPSGYALPNIISVAATDQNDNLSSFSNYGQTTVHVAAPGSNILSTVPARASVLSNDLISAAGWTFNPGSSWSISGDILTNAGYPNSDSSWAISPSLDLSSSTKCKIELLITGSSEYNQDILLIQIRSGSGAWQTLNFPQSGDYSDAWYSAASDIYSFDGKNPVQIRFYFTSNSTNNAYAGWSIKSLKVTASSSDYTSAYEYWDGTSMATPHVSGMAALIWSAFPAYSADQIKYIIMNSVDLKPSLSAKVSSGGRINVYNALMLPAKPTALSATVVSSGRVDLSWTNNAPDALGFKVERKIQNGTYVEIKGNVAASLPSYSDTGTPSSSTVTYRARTYNSYGNSLYSDEVTVSTPSAASSNQGSSGACFIATAAFGSPLERHVVVLREFRDSYLLNSSAGRKFVEFYYRHSPPAAKFISEHGWARLVTRAGLMPLIILSYLIVSFGTGGILGLAIIFSIILILLKRALSYSMNMRH